jgi:predicted O-methyltransferase YrrM
MYNHFQLGFKYLQYFFTASNGRGHGIHSPFVFEFVEQVLLPSYKKKVVYNKIEKIRSSYIADANRFVDVEDLGAGSVSSTGSRRSIAQIAKGAAKHPKFARLLHRMVAYYGVASVLELGTSLGLTTRYLAIANEEVKVQTIEGAPAIADFSREAFSQEGFNNINILVGDFDLKLPEALSNMTGKKLFFFDGNHQYLPTIRYFEEVLKTCGEEDILVFDDIHWSEEMEMAWQEIKKNERVSCSIDLFFIGIVFLRKEFKEKLDFTIRF